MSWELSAFARATMDGQLRQACGTPGVDGFNNPASLARLVAELGCAIRSPASAAGR